MKKTITTLLISLLIISGHVGYSQFEIFSDDWESYFQFRPLNCIEWENDTVLWVGGTNFLGKVQNKKEIEFTTQNSSLIDDNIQHLKYRNGVLWLSTPSGLTKLQNGVFTHYSTTNGLLNNSVLALDIDSKNNVWVATPSGISMFDGSTFNNYPSIKATNLAISAGDTVYVCGNSLRTDGQANDIFYYHSGTWNTSSIDNTPSDLGIVKLHSTYLRNVYLTSVNKGAIQVQGEKLFGNSRELNFYKNQNNYATLVSENLNGLYVFYENRLGNIGGIVNWDGNDSTIIGAEDVKYLAGYKNKLACGFQRGVRIQIKNSKELYEYEELDLNNIKMGVNGDGTLFNSGNYYNYPKFEIGKEQISGLTRGNIWLGAKEKSGLKRFAGSNIQSGFDFWSGTMRNNFRVKNRRPIVKVNKSTIDFHMKNYNSAGYSIPLEIKNWPANGDSALGEAKNLAPFVDANSNGYYDPENGDYPCIKGDQAIYFIFNDNENVHTASGAVSLFVEIHGMAYCWNSLADPALQNAVFVDYTIINRSKNDYVSFLFGQEVHSQLGNPSDDFVGFDSTLQCGYTYNSDLVDEKYLGYQTFESNPPAIAYGIIDNRAGSFVSFNDKNGVNGIPRNGVEYFNVITGNWRNGDNIKYGGNGISFQGQKTKLMFTGDPLANTGWNEIKEGNTPGNRKTILASQELSLNSGDQKTFTLAFVFGQEVTPGSNSHLRNITLAKANFAAAKSYIQSQTSSCDYSSVWASNNNANSSTSDTESGFYTFPNPTSGSINIRSEENLVEVQILSTAGLLLQSFNQQSSFNELTLPLDFTDGLYLVRWFSENGKTGINRVVLNH